MLELQDTLRQMQQMTPKDIEQYEVKFTRYYVLLLSPSPDFRSVLLYDGSFSSILHIAFWPLTTMLMSVFYKHYKQVEMSKFQEAAFVWTVAGITHIENGKRFF